MTTASIVGGASNKAENWPLIQDLLGGTRAMRDARTKWLPIEPAESAVKYDARLGRSILYNGFRDTKCKLKNRPFTHPITVTDLPEEISYLEDDVDGNGKTLEAFIKEALDNLIKYGITHIYVSHSRIPDIGDGKELTKADEAEIGARVYLINISPVDLLGWQTEKNVNQIDLTQIRVYETRIEASGDYGDKETNYINVFNKDTWEIHKQDEKNKDKYDLVESGYSTFGRIPLVTVYANRTGFMTADPPLMDLAWLNLAHWQSYSDQRNILRFSRFGLLFGKGMPEEMVEKGSIEIGPTKAYIVAEENAELKYVEHTGKGVEAGQKDIEDIEQKMRVLGNQPLMKNIPGTATSERIDENRTISQLQSWVTSLEQGINHALKLACEWRKCESKDTMGVDIFKDFEATILGGGDKELLLKMRDSGEITGERLLREEQRRGVFSQDMSPADEAKAAAAESGKELESFLPDEEEDNEDDEE